MNNRPVPAGTNGIVPVTTEDGVREFVQSHRASHREHVAADLAGTPKLGTLMMLPYARIVPMPKVEHRMLQGARPR